MCVPAPIPAAFPWRDAVHGGQRYRRTATHRPLATPTPRGRLDRARARGGLARPPPARSPSRRGQDWGAASATAGDGAPSHLELPRPSPITAALLSTPHEGEKKPCHAMHLLPVDGARERRRMHVSRRRRVGCRRRTQARGPQLAYPTPACLWLWVGLGCMDACTFAFAKGCQRPRGQRDRVGGRITAAVRIIVILHILFNCCLGIGAYENMLLHMLPCIC